MQIPQTPPPKMYRLLSGIVIPVPPGQAPRYPEGARGRSPRFQARRSSLQATRWWMVSDRPRGATASTSRRSTRTARSRSSPCALRRSTVSIRTSHDPRGMIVVGADGLTAGTVVDIWIDALEEAALYLEVSLTLPAVRGTARPGPDPFCSIPQADQSGEGPRHPGRAVRPGAQTARTGPDHATRRGQAGRLFRRRQRFTPCRAGRGRCCEPPCPKIIRDPSMPKQRPYGSAGAASFERADPMARLAGVAERCAACPARARTVDLFRRFYLAICAARALIVPTEAICVLARRPDRAGRHRTRSARPVRRSRSRRTSVYTVTDRRVVLRIGVALTASLNLPFRQIEQASVRLHADGSGDIPLVDERRDAHRLVHAVAACPAVAHQPRPADDAVRSRRGKRGRYPVECASE